jgi:hypothetical protein
VESCPGFPRATGQPPSAAKRGPERGPDIIFGIIFARRIRGTDRRGRGTGSACAADPTLAHTACSGVTLSSGGRGPPVGRRTVTSDRPALSGRFGAKANATPKINASRYVRANVVIWMLRVRGATPRREDDALHSSTGAGTKRTTLPRSHQQLDLLDGTQTISLLSMLIVNACSLKFGGCPHQVLGR